MRKLIGAANLEIAVHAAVFFLVYLPLYCLILPAYYTQRGVADGWAASRRLLRAFTGIWIPSVEEIRGDGYRLDWASAAIALALLIIAAWIFYRKSSDRLKPVLSGTVYARDKRRYKILPERLRQHVEGDLALLWRITGDVGRVPRIYCFPASSPIACALSDGGTPAIAVSVGVLERWSRGLDRLTRVMLLHEIGHILRGDQIRLPKAEVLLSVLRTFVFGLIGTVTAISAIWAVCEKYDVGAIEPSVVSAIAYLRGIVNPMAFTYLSLIVMTRYMSLIILLTELRADLTAAQLDDGIESFVSVLNSDTAVRDSGWRGWWRSLLSMSVTHLGPRERTELLQRPDRLLTPKLRYFALSLILPIVLLLLGIRGFVASSEKATLAFLLVITVGLTGAVVALNIATVLMVLNVGGSVPGRLVHWRLLVIAVAVVCANLLLSWNEYSIVFRADEWLTSVLDPNFREPWDQSILRGAALGRELLAPFLVPLRDGRLVAWVAAVYVSLLYASRRRKMYSQLFQWGIAGTILLGTVWERLSVSDIPFFNILRMLHINRAPAASLWVGPVIGIGLGLITAALLGRTLRDKELP